MTRKASPKPKPAPLRIVSAVLAHPEAASGCVFVLLACSHWTITRTEVMQARWNETRHHYGRFGCTACARASR